jgi:hypothetical protein
MFSVGLGVVGNYRQAYSCIEQSANLGLRFVELYNLISNTSASLDYFQFWLNFTLAIGNVSTTYKNCYSNTEGSIYQFYYFILQYRSLTNYLVYLLPNMLSYAFVVKTWMDRMSAL